ncbi:tetratricopeptide repeat protein [Bacillus thuringiensis]|uniref:tetratricopeptide repeat protein n=1 Tax=Bacillus thuringiensis TaxID=1428 RepID=UPI001155D7EA|nr:tetratricopeptide repeat protein [Bacillus thuringiensis]
MTYKNEKNPRKLGLALVSGVIFLTTLSIFSVPSISTNATSTNSNISSIDNKSITSDRINYLKTKAIRYYRDRGNYNEIKNLSREATTLDSYDINLKFDLASAQIMQNKLPEALHTYSNILSIDPNNFNAHLLFAVYSKINGDAQSTSNHLKIMSQIDSKNVQNIKTI